MITRFRHTEVLPLAAALCLCAAASRLHAQPDSDAAKPLKVVGSFSNIRTIQSTGDALGRAVDLWRQDGKLFGRLFLADGQPADFPMVLLEDGAINVRTNRIRLKGVSGARANEIYTIYTLTGQLRPAALDGELLIEIPSLATSPTRGISRERLHLGRNRDTERFLLHDYPSFSSWLEDVSRYLRR